MHHANINTVLGEQLVSLARLACDHAYAPYSEFPVGVSILASDGRIFTGVNVENASYGLTICGERSAFVSAISCGAKEFLGIAIFTPTETASFPCGACRQFMAEFCSNVPIFIGCNKGEIVHTSVVDLLPNSFHFSQGDKTSISTYERTPQQLAMCIDIDNVLAASDSTMRKCIERVTNGRVHLSYDDICSFDYWRCSDIHGQQITYEEWKVCHDLFSSPEIISQIAVLPGAVEAVKELSKGFKIHFATSRLPAARQATLEWLHSHGFPSEDTHFVSSGQKHQAVGPVWACVEDDLNQAMAFAKSGCLFPLVISHPWNALGDRTWAIRRVTGWEQVLDILL
ncbi:cytidine deaminase [Planctopirus hydrillae]|nr:cytidine deaminase [Planctopirus hydrillae]